MAKILKIKTKVKTNKHLERLVRLMIRPWLWYNMQKSFFNAWLRDKGLRRFPEFEYLLDWKNSHRGERCFIVATGPSLTIEDLNLIKNEYSMSMNSGALMMDKTEWKPDVLGIGDEYVYQKLESRLLNIFSGPMRERLIISDYVQSFFRTARQFKSFPVNMLDHKFVHEKTGIIRFSDDCYKVVYDNYSIIFNLMQLAIYMGFSKIYLLGTDCDYNQPKAHFIDHGVVDPFAAYAGERLIYVHSKFNEFAQKHGVKVFNCTRGGMLEVYPRITLDEVILGSEKRTQI